MSDRWLGIDFSGCDARWSPRTARSNVWVAEVVDRGGGLVLSALCRVQGLAPAGDPFTNLANLLSAGMFRAAGIDAPFCIPARHLGARTHAGLLAAVQALPRDGRRFARGRDLVRALTGEEPPLHPEKKPLRETERRWTGRGVNVRSALWAGPRGGAPFAAACLTLLAAADRPVWPFAAAADGLLVEAFPAGQLRQWGLPHDRYADAAGRARRDVVVDALGRRVALGQHERTLRECADATDAVLCVFGAIAARRGPLADAPSAAASAEGWIAVHA